LPWLLGHADNKKKKINLICKGAKATKTNCHCRWLFCGDGFANVGKANATLNLREAI